MVKYYTANVTVMRTVTISIAASSKADALLQARQQAQEAIPDGILGEVELILEGEPELNVGTRVRHAVHGDGVVTAIAPVTNADGKKGKFRIDVVWESGKTIGLILPLTEDKLGILQPGDSVELSEVSVCRIDDVLEALEALGGTAMLGELKKYLEKKGFDPATVARAIEAAVAAGNIHVDRQGTIGSAGKAPRPRR